MNVDDKFAQYDVDLMNVMLAIEAKDAEKVQAAIEEIYYQHFSEPFDGINFLRWFCAQHYMTLLIAMQTAGITLEDEVVRRGITTQIPEAPTHG